MEEITFFNNIIRKQINLILMSLDEKISEDNP